MEDAGVQRGIWDGDAKTVQQCLTDIFTSVYTTCDIPENAIFGPCVLSHTSLYDSIAFIALKSTDKRTVPYIFRVDTSAANGSSEGLMWLRLVQSAREREEQNLEAYIKSGQLFYRSLRRIAKDEELLVWYGKELTELLLLGPARAPARTNGGCTARPAAVPGTRKEGDSRRRGESGGGGRLRDPPLPIPKLSADIPSAAAPADGALFLSLSVVPARRRLAALRLPRVQPALPVRTALRRPPPVPLPQEAARPRHRPRRRGRRRQGRQGAGARQSSAAAAVAAAAAGPLQLQLPSALTLLPPSFTSLCLPAQNWCAKCNASFRMTSDLVYHMRSHHKKEYALEPLVKRRREEKLKCPICNESFRERHHLSRHMTSHN
ncbi:PRDM8 protein, partial [Horornis vulcanius]|nr:PRDM8 protein [Horornis vulcanius]